MLTFFQVCFFVGVGLTILSVIIGNVFDALDFDGLDLDVFDIDIFLPISPMLTLIFLTVFGGSGIILYNITNGFLVFLSTFISLAIGVGVSFIIYKFIISPLKKAQNTSSPTKEQLIGLNAVVTETIQQDGYGEISYIWSGSSFKAPAKSTEHVKIEKGMDVAICWIEDYTFYVAPISFQKSLKSR